MPVSLSCLPAPLRDAAPLSTLAYAEAGYGVATFLGRSAESLVSFNNPAATEVLGAKLVRQAVNPDGDLWLVPDVSPIFTPFRAIPPHEEKHFGHIGDV